MMVQRTKKNPVERFWEKVDKRSEDECWEWLGVATYNGHGQFNTGAGKMVNPPKFSYLINNGDVPPKHRIFHTCKNKLCVNPDHLYLTSSETLFWSKVNKDTESGCWEWTGATYKCGYGKFGRKNYLAHRYSYQSTYGPIPEGMCVLHRCDNYLCVNPTHLFLGTQKDNAEDRERKGRGNQPKWEKHNKAKLIWEQVREIRSTDWGTLSHSEIGKMFGVGDSAIWAILSYRHWKEDGSES